MVTIDEANDVIGKIVLLEESFVKTGAFYFLIKEISALVEGQVISGKHADVLRIVRAAVLRSTFSGVMACLDTQDRRGNRASVGEIIRQLKNPELGKIFETGVYAQSKFASDVQALEIRFDELRRSAPYQNTKDLRDREIAHTLIKKSAAKNVLYSDVDKLYCATEGYLDTLFHIAGLKQATFRDRYSDHKSNAELFVSTYTSGMHSLSNSN